MKKSKYEVNAILAKANEVGVTQAAKEAKVSTSRIYYWRSKRNLTTKPVKNEPAKIALPEPKVILKSKSEPPKLASLFEEYTPMVIVAVPFKKLTKVLAILEV